jgi:mono/diheme cytochrome c family protein
MVALYLLWPVGVTAQDPDEEVLEDPVAQGAWLYEGNCVRCHGPYQQERVGSLMASKKELVTAITQGGCQISWGRRYGGPFGSSEIKAIAAYITAWEEAGGPPELPELPAQPTVTPTPTKPASDLLPTPTSTPTPAMDEKTRLIVSSNRLAHGAWLYTQHCYRCHQSYPATRMGRGMTEEDIHKTIKNGKTSTQMTPFSRRKGGELKVQEIKDIVFYIVTWEEMEAPPALPAGLLVAPTPNPADLIPVSLPEIPTPKGNARRGSELYGLHCAECHGDEGKGEIGPRLAKDWLSVRPDLTIKATISQGVPGSPMAAWGQDQDGPLTEEQISDLVIFIVSWSTDNSPSNLISGATLWPWSGFLGLVLLVPVVLGLVRFLSSAGDK